MKKEKKKKQKYVDDGHTIYNMDVDGMPHRTTKNKDGIYLTKEEKKAMIKSAMEHYLPILFGVLLCFGITILLIYFWLK